MTCLLLKNAAAEDAAEEAAPSEPSNDVKVEMTAKPPADASVTTKRMADSGSSCSSNEPDDPLSFGSGIGQRATAAAVTLAVDKQLADILRNHGCQGHFLPGVSAS